MLKNVYVGGAMRTPFGAFNGALSTFTAPQLGSIAIGATLKKAQVDPREIDEVYFGNVIQAGSGQNVARQAARGAGVGVEVGATTVNKVCGSSLRTAIIAAQAIQCGDARLVVAGGCESMSNAPYLLRKARTGYRMGNAELVDAMIYDGLWDVYTGKHMGSCGDLCATKYNISREDQDTFAIESYKRAIHAWDDGFYAAEVVPVEVKDKNGSHLVDHDEDVAKFHGEEKIRALPGAFGPNSTVTAANASKINDGAASMVVFDDDARKALGLKPSARILGHANVAMEPDWFTIAPIYAIRKLCEQLKLKPGDVDFYEINEAFAVVAVVAIRELKLDPTKVNVCGGAVAIGHPIGATGARILNTVVHALHQFNKTIGIACLCIGGGEATAVAVERM
ncbi:MAG: thiolase family protein [Planctomycetes bacterium]|nr:thiolase family protein [Planctomycetota bacterium]MBI3833768.1 thiolase family protein [Planctomycetota bacterium]